MNAGIIILQDGTPCLVYDEQLPHPIRHVEFCREDFLVRLVYDRTGPKQWKQFDFPLEHDLVALLEERKTVTVAEMRNKQLSDIKIYPVIFI